MNAGPLDVATVRALATHVLWYAAYALYAAALTMLCAIALIGNETGDFPGRWMIAVVGCVAAGLVLHYGANDLEPGPESVRSSSAEQDDPLS